MKCRTIPFVTWIAKKLSRVTLVTGFLVGPFIALSRLVVCWSALEEAGQREDCREQSNGASWRLSSAGGGFALYTVRILFLAADPYDEARTAHDLEFREIERRLRECTYREAFRTIKAGAIQRRDFVEALHREQPEIVHFAGHGTSEGLLLLDESGRAKPIDTDRLVDILDTLAGSVQLVFLNACFSASQAEAIKEHVDFVIAMGSEIGRQEAISFSSQFYWAIGMGMSVSDAFRLARAALDNDDGQAGGEPQLLVREGAKPDSPLCGPGRAERSLSEKKPGPRLSLPWLFKVSPLNAFLIAMVVGMTLICMAIVCEVADGYLQSINWGINFLTVVPIGVLFMYLSVHRSVRCIARFNREYGPLAGRDTITGGSLARMWRERLQKLNVSFLLMSALAVLVNVSDWFNHFRIGTGGWKAEAPLFGLVAAAWAGVATMLGVGFVCLMAAFIGQLNELCSRCERARLERQRPPTERRRGLGTVFPVLESALVAVGFTYVALYFSNVQHIAIEYKRELTEVLFSPHDFFDMGPLQYNSTLVIAGCAALLLLMVFFVLCIEQTVYRIQRLRSGSSPAPGQCWPMTCLSRGGFVALAALGFFCFIFYRFGPLFIIGLTAMLFAQANRSMFRRNVSGHPDQRLFRRMGGSAHGITKE